MTIKEVPTEILTESLLALADLRRKYKREPMVTVYRTTNEDGLLYEQCPLCIFQLKNTGFYPWDRGKVEEMGESCTCPWYWLEGHGCEEFVEVQDEDSVTYDDFPIPDRLTRIDRWESAITEELAARSKANG